MPKNRSFLVSYTANPIVPPLDQLQTQQNIDNVAERVIGFLKQGCLSNDVV